MAEATIRALKPEDRERLFDLVRSTLSETGALKAAIFSPALWEWQCLSPGFEALVVVAEDGQELVGCYHLVSRDMKFFGQQHKMALLQELGVLPAYRRQGLFMKMSEFAVERAAAQGWSLTYSFPNHRSFPGFIKKQGYRHLGNASVWVRPLNPARMLEARLPLKTVGRAVARVGMAMFDAVFSMKEGVAQEIGEFSSEVNAISSNFLTGEKIGCVRDARFLNWRFLQKPTHEYTAWGLRREGNLTAYLVTRRASMFGADCMLLMDFGCLTGCEADLLRLIGGRVAAGRSEGAVLAVAMGLHPFFRRLGRLGFIRVPEQVNPRPVRFIVRRHGDRVDDRVYRFSNWFTTLADWDVL